MTSSSPGMNVSVCECDGALKYAYCEVFAEITEVLDFNCQYRKNVCSDWSAVQGVNVVRTVCLVEMRCSACHPHQ